MTIEEIGVDDLALVLADNLIDVRETDEYEEAHVPGAVHVPLGSLTRTDLERFRGRRLYVICKSGGRSFRACEYLASEGYDAVNVAGGTMAWIASGHPVHGGPSPS